MATAASPDYAGVEDSIKQGYGAQRQKAASTEAANLQGQRDALARRAAALGNAPGGAFVKAEQTAGNDSAQRLQQANAGIDDAQNQELRGLKMTQLGQQYTTSERQGSQDFAASQQANAFAHEDTSQAKTFAHEDTSQATGIAAQKSLQDKQLEVQQLMQKTGLDAQSAMQQAGFTQEDKELSKTQDFQGAMLNSQQVFADNQRKATEQFQGDTLNAQQTFAADQAQKDRDIKVDEFLQQIGLSREQFAHEVGVDTFNEEMATKMFNKKDMLEGFFGNFSGGSLSSGGKKAGGSLSEFWKGLTTNGNG